MAEVHEALDGRFAELIAEGATFTSVGRPGFWVWNEQKAAAHQWITAAGNLVGIATAKRGVHWDQAVSVLENEHLARGVPMDAVTRMRGVLQATDEDRKRGLLRQIEYTIYAETFDDFLDHAETFHKSGKVQESAILASAVLEDTIKRIAKKHEVDATRSLEPVIDDLITADVFTPVQGKRVKAHAGVRNGAFHAKWDELDLESIGAAITGIRELIESHLD